LVFDDREGRLLWKSDTGLPMGGGFLTYTVRRKQYVAVAAGMHAPVTWKLESEPAELVCYALP
jgi:glucose dehydrogenase